MSDVVENVNKEQENSKVTSKLGFREALKQEVIQTVVVAFIMVITVFVSLGNSSDAMDGFISATLFKSAQSLMLASVFVCLAMEKLGFDRFKSYFRAIFAFSKDLSVTILIALTMKERATGNEDWWVHLLISSFMIVIMIILFLMIKPEKVEFKLKGWVDGFFSKKTNNKLDTLSFWLCIIAFTCVSAFYIHN